MGGQFIGLPHPREAFLRQIQSETSDTIVPAMMGGAKETLSRDAIKEMKSLDRTLMPDGLEAAISKEQMSDLLAFLRSAGAPTR